MTAAKVRPAVVAALCVTAISGCDSRPAPRLATPERDPDVVRIEAPSEVELALTDAPRPLEAIVTRKNGVVDTVRVRDARSEDTAVVRVIDDAVVPHGVGHAKLVFVLSGYLLTARATVIDRLADESVALSAGEVRAWELLPGWYDIAMRRADTTVASPLQLAAPLTCAPHSLDPDAISCRVRDTTRLVLKHSGRGGRDSAYISILRVQ